MYGVLVASLYFFLSTATFCFSSFLGPALTNIKCMEIYLTRKPKHNHIYSETCHFNERGFGFLRSAVKMNWKESQLCCMH